MSASLGLVEKDFTYSTNKICFYFEHMYIPVESSKTGNCGIYNFILPIGYRLTELHIVDIIDEKQKISMPDLNYDAERINISDVNNDVNL